MLHAIDQRLDQPSVTNSDLQKFEHLDLQYDPSVGLLWKFLKKTTTPFFSHEQLNEIRRVQSALSEGTYLPLPHYRPEDVRYVVFGSRLPGVFSLGGDLQLFRELIERRDRTALGFYAKKAAAAVYHHATSTRNITTFSLVQGSAMGGGFEAAIAGNVVVAERGVRMGFPEVLFGLFPGMGAYTLLRRRVSPATAERLIIEAENLPAEELHRIGIVDLLVDPGEGQVAIFSYISKQQNRPGANAFRRALNRVHVVDHNELYSIAEEWVDAAMELPEANLRRIDRLVRSQSKLNPTKTTGLIEQRDDLVRDLATIRAI